LYVVLLFVAVSAMSCRKLIDKYFPGRDGGGGTSNCRIESMYSFDATYTFKYNAFGKLDSIVADKPFDRGEVHRMSFTYDNQQRLYEMRRMLESNDYNSEIWDIHRYGYTGDRITTDTIFDIRVGVYRMWLADLKYDSSGRIVKETLTILYSDNEWESPYLETEYNYDANGNRLMLDWETDIQYTDHKNPLRTDKMLQFLARDYSRNARIGATAYNADDFPTEFNRDYEFAFSAPNGIARTIVYPRSITYSCEQK
jgi:hypothetical protein